MDAAATYALNFPGHVDARPIEDIETTTFADAAGDVLIGGPPCQGFSLLNRERDGDLRRTLWREYLRALRETDASYFVMENVPQLLKSPEFESFREEVASEFHIREAVLNAADFGVPQVRRRAIVIGCRRELGTPPWPTPTHVKPGTVQPELDGAGRQPWVTVREALAGVPLRPGSAAWHDDAWHRPRNPTAKSLVRYAHVPVGGNRFDMQAALDAAGLGDLVPRCWREKPNGTVDVFGRLKLDAPAPTIRTEFYKPEKGRYLHPTEDRPITPYEAALLMTFPVERCLPVEERFVFPETQSLTSVGRQIGNAVPPLLGRRIAEAIGRHLTECTTRGVGRETVAT